jgi:hypothetical protein
LGEDLRGLEIERAPLDAPEVTFGHFRASRVSPLASYYSREGEKESIYEAEEEGGIHITHQMSNFYETAEPFPWDNTRGQSDKKTCALPNGGEKGQDNNVEQLELVCPAPRCTGVCESKFMPLTNVGA